MQAARVEVVRGRTAHETGSVLPVVALLLVAVGGLVVAVGDVGVEAITAARARAAADAAALAGAAEGEPAAHGLAAANGARVVAYEADGREVQVAVELGGTVARARAARRGGGVPHGSATAAGLTPAMREALAAAEEVLGRPVPVTSGWRSPAAQQALWARRATNPFPVARPGTSAHERGTAVDVPRSFASVLAAVGPSVGLCRPLPTSDPVHFELCRATGAGG